MPVSGSTSTSTMCVPKLGRRALRVDAARSRRSGRRSCRRCSAMSASDIGLSLPALAPAGRTRAVLRTRPRPRAAPTAWRRACTALLDQLARGLHGRHAAREGDAAAAGEEVEAERAGVADDRRGPCRRRCPAPRPPSSHSEARRPPMSGVPAISDSVPSSLSVQRHRGLAADVEPEARGDAAALVLAAAACVQCACALAASSVSIKPIGPNFGP